MIIGFMRRKSLAKGVIHISFTCNILAADKHSHMKSALAWWSHLMETFSVLLDICVGNSPVPGEFPEKTPVTRSFDVFFDLRLNKRLSKQPWGWWLKRHRAHYDVIVMACFHSSARSSHHPHSVLPADFSTTDFMLIAMPFGIWATSLIYLFIAWIQAMENQGDGKSWYQIIVPTSVVTLNVFL